MMDYHALACELLNVRADLVQVPANQQLSKMVKGELFVLNYLLTHEKIVHPKELSKKWRAVFSEKLMEDVEVQLM